MPTLQNILPLSALPLVIEPRTLALAGSGIESMVAWARSNRSSLDNHLQVHGAILFRSFEIRSPEAFESLATTISPILSEYVGGISPRQHVVGNVSTSTEAPAMLPIPLH